MDIAELAVLLHETAEHHDAFEKATPKHDWWDWYAPYLAARLDGQPSAAAETSADAYVERTRGIVRAQPQASSG